MKANEMRTIANNINKEREEMFEKALAIYMERYVYAPIKEKAEKGGYIETITASTIYPTERVVAILEENGFTCTTTKGFITIEW